MAPSRPARFEFVNGTSKTIENGAITATLDWDVDANQQIRTLQITLRNNTPRRIDFTNQLGARLRHRDSSANISAVGDNIHINPEDCFKVRFRADEQMGGWGKVFAESSNGKTSKFDLFDIPYHVDDKVGTILEKKSVSWEFRFTPGASEVREEYRDEANSSVTRTWNEFVPGISLVSATAS